MYSVYSFGAVYSSKLYAACLSVKNWTEIQFIIFQGEMIMELKKCEVCGKSFEFDHTRRKYCSKECFKKGICAMKKEWRKEHLPYQPKVIYCQICGKPVEAELGAVSISRPKMHEICIINDIVDTIKQGKKLSGTQINRKARLGLTKDEIMEYVNAN